MFKVKPSHHNKVETPRDEEPINKINRQSKSTYVKGKVLDNMDDSVELDLENADELTDYKNTDQRPPRIKLTPLNLMDLAPAVPTNNIPTPLLTPLEPQASLTKNR